MLRLKLFLNQQQSEQQFMNFERDEPFDKQLGNLLALIILFERKIENLRKKLVGNEDFHTRLVFHQLDYRKQGDCKPEDILYALQERDRTLTLPMCQSLCRKYSTTGAINYNEFLHLISPKTDQILSQRLMMRIVKRGAVLPKYLWEKFQQLLCSIITMTNMTENIKKSIQRSSDLSYLEMVEFFKKRLNTNHSIYKFCNMNSDEEYDFAVDDVKFLSTHIQSKNDVTDMTDEDIKELICPLELNFSKPVLQMAGYYETLKRQMKKTVQGFSTMPQQTKHYEKVPNFLHMTYQKTVQNNILRENIPMNVSKPWERKQMRPEKQEISSYRRKNINEQPDTSSMYLENFMKPPSSGRAKMDLDDYLFKRRSQGEKFVDELEGNIESELDQSESAFYHY